MVAPLWSALVVPPRLDGRVLDRMLPMLVGLNVDWLRRNSFAPWLYYSGVRYQAEAPGKEQWLTIPIVLAQGFADCEDLACWRVAELIVRRGERAKAIWSGREKNGRRLYHIRVQRADWRVEDPSLILGMGMGEWGDRHSIRNGHRS